MPVQARSDARCSAKQPSSHAWQAALPITLRLLITSNALSLGCAPSDRGAAATSHVPSVLVFSKTAVYRHKSIETGVQALRDIAAHAGWTVDATEDANRISDESLRNFNVLLFLSTTGDVLDETQQAAMRRFIQAGKGYVGVHSASDTEYDWAWYGALVGAYFNAHPPVQAANIQVVDPKHATTRHLPAVWQRNDEWYGFRAQPDPAVHVLLQLDESSYDAGVGAMLGGHPIAWSHEYDGGRAFYTALGHTKESYAEPLFLTHLEQAIAWAAGN